MGGGGWGGEGGLLLLRFWSAHYRSASLKLQSTPPHILTYIPQRSVEVRTYTLLTFPSVGLRCIILPPQAAWPAVCLVSVLDGLPPSPPPFRAAVSGIFFQQHFSVSIAFKSFRQNGASLECILNMRLLSTTVVPLKRVFVTHFR